jgi:hypothetical protein
MNNRNKLGKPVEPVEPFKAKLRHYHRSASPELYVKKQKRWDDASPEEFSDNAKPKVSDIPDLLSPEKGKSSGL